MCARPTLPAARRGVPSARAARARGCPVRSGAGLRGRGFTLLEIVVVMAIIAVLAAAVLLGVVRGPASRGPTLETTTVLHKAKALVENWERQFDSYPPSDLHHAGDNGINGPVEAVYQALVRADAPYAALRAEELGNTDADRLPTGGALLELTDAWGHPLVYFQRDDYGSGVADGLTYVNGLGDQVVARPCRRADGSFVNPRTFQIYSMGPDGEPNTEDDVLPWSQS